MLDEISDAYAPAFSTIFKRWKLFEIIFLEISWILSASSKAFKNTREIVVFFTFCINVKLWRILISLAFREFLLEEVLHELLFLHEI